MKYTMLIILVIFIDVKACSMKISQQFAIDATKTSFVIKNEHDFIF